MLAWRSISCSALRKDDSDDEAVQGQSLGEDHHENECDQDISLSVATDTSVTNNTNAETGSQVGKTAAEASSKLLITSGVSVLPVLGVHHGGCIVRSFVH